MVPSVYRHDRLTLLTKKQIVVLIVAMATVASLFFAAIFMVFNASAANVLTVVRPNDIRPISEVVSGPAGWYETTTGSGSVELNTDVPYNTAGSAQFSVADSASYAELGHYKQLGGTKLADLASLSYATWQEVDATKAVSLQLNMDYDTTDAYNGWQGRMVFEPYRNTDFYGNGVTDGVWQTWLTLEDDAVWWMTWRDMSSINPCPQADPCTVSEIMNMFPNIGITTGVSGDALVLKAGSGWSSFVGYADAPTVAYSANDAQIWDFEPALTMPTTKEQCFKGGWSTYGDAFKNQGACVSYVVRLE